MRRSRGVRIWIVWVAILFARPAAGQSLSSGSIDGVVVSDGGEAVAGAMVTIVHERSGTSRSVASLREGGFNFVGLPAGEYQLMAEQIRFQPQVLRGLTLRPGQRLSIEVRLPVLSGVAERADTLVFTGADLAGRGPEIRMDIGVDRLRRFPNDYNDLREIGRLSSLAGPELEIQGLPASMASVRVDGIGFSGFESSSFQTGANHLAAFPLGMFDIASLTISNPDVEWGSGTGGTVEGISLRGGRDLEIETYGLAGVQSRTAAPDGLSDSGQRFDGRLLISGPIIRDTATFAAGLEFARRPESPPAHALTAEGWEESSEIARELYDLDTPPNPSRQTLSGFAHIGWQMTGNTQVDAWGSFAAFSSAGNDPLFQSIASPSWGYDGRDVFGGVTLSSRFTNRVSQETRIGVESLSRKSGYSDRSAPAGTARIISSGVRLGSDWRQPSGFERLVIRASETLHLSLGRHRLKVGIAGAFASATLDPARISEAIFASAEDFSAGLGYTVRGADLRPRARFDTPQLSLFAQETWTSPSGISVLLGLRANMERLPVAEVRLNDDWFDVSGLRNTDVDETSLRVDPRFGIAWDVQNRHEMIVSASAGAYSGFADPLLLGEWIAGNGGTPVVRRFGADGGWPDGPLAVHGETATPLFLMTRDAAGARTVRGDLGFSRTFRRGTALHVRAHYRDTDHLPRTRDLNLAQPTAEDQFGRPVYGELRQRGSLLYVEPGTNRRFSGFDQVTAVDYGGWSTYMGVTTTLEHGADTDFAGFVSYTFSRTEDNWAPGLGGTYPSSLGAGAATWMEGRSDFDVPHRLTVGVEANPAVLGPARLALLYRYRSGYPFTPGFQDGIDATGDGRVGNDPAFVDRTTPGMEELIGGWDCLGGQIGRLSERNACRTEGHHSLDASVGAIVARSDRWSAEVLVEAIHLLDRGRLVPDAALYLIDPERPLVMTDGLVELPLMVNPNFGQSRGVAVPGRALRIGFRLNH